jgi:ubiquinone/menaquinone biosynthesis C-methylase UbiE
LTVVDLGCGSGAWAIEVADEYHKARVFGLDISLIQPSWVPDNMYFIIADITQPLIFDDCSVDLVQSRYTHSY